MASNTLTDPDQADFENQMAYANALRKRALDNGGQMISGHYVGKNPWLSLAEGLVGSMTGRRAMDSQKQRQAQRQQEFDTFMGARPSIYNEFEGQVATPEQQFGPTQAPVVKQKALKSAAQMLEDQQNWIARPGGESNPLIQAVRQQAMLKGLDWPEKMLTQEGTLQLGRDKIAADAQNRKDQRDFIAGQNDLNRQAHENNIRLTASLRPAPVGSNSSPANQDAADLIAARFLEGDQNALVGISRNKELHAAVMSSVARQAKEQNISPAELVQRGLEFGSEKSAQRKIGERGATVEMAAKEASNMIPIVTDLSRKIPRTEFPTINAAGNIIKKQSGDPNVVAFDQSIDTLINGYARAISPTGVPTVADKKRAHEKLNAAFSQGQLDATVAVMQQEMDAAVKSPGQASAARREARVGKPEGAATGKHLGTYNPKTGNFE